MDVISGGDCELLNAAGFIGTASFPTKLKVQLVLGQREFKLLPACRLHLFFTFLALVYRGEGGAFRSGAAPYTFSPTASAAIAARQISVAVRTCFPSSILPAIEPQVSIALFLCLPRKSGRITRPPQQACSANPKYKHRFLDGAALRNWADAYRRMEAHRDARKRMERKNFFEKKAWQGWTLPGDIYSRT